MTPKTLEQVRDELAVKRHSGVRDGKSDFEAGFDACLKALAERAGEFDEKAADKQGKLSAKDSASDSFTEEMNYATGFLHGARWQQSQDIATLELERERTRKLVDKLKARCKFVDDEFLRESVRADIKQYEESGE